MVIAITHTIIVVSVVAAVTILGALHVIDTAAITSLLGVAIAGQAAVGITQARKDGSSS